MIKKIIVLLFSCFTCKLSVKKRVVGEDGGLVINKNSHLLEQLDTDLMIVCVK